MFLGETLNSEQITGSIMIFIGLIVISINWSKGAKSLRKKPLLYMLFASLFVATSGVIFKYVTVENNFWVSSFWEYLGLGFTGILIFLFMAKQRKEFMHMNKKGGVKIFVVNIFSEFMSIAGNLLTNFALLLAPVALVYVVGSFQPAILLILTILGTYLFPHIVKEDMSWQILYPKIVALVIMAIGSAILFL